MSRFSSSRSPHFLAPSRLRLVVLLLLIAPTALGLLSPAEAPAQSPVLGTTSPVVFIVFDEWSVSSVLEPSSVLDPPSLLQPSARINERRYPNLAALASRSTWFTYDGTAHPFTTQAVPAILTGGYGRVVPPDYRNYPNNLFTLFSPTYRVHATESDTHLCPETVCAPRPPVARPLSRAEVFARFLGELDASPKTLHFLHLVLPHAPFEYLPTGSRYEPGPALEGLQGEVWDSREPWFATFNYERDLLQARFVDHLIGQLTARLLQLGIFDQTAIVITADHGVSFRPGQYHRRPRGESKYEVGLVPLFIKAPFQLLGTSNTTHVRSIDVLPTLAGQLGITMPWPTQGRDIIAQPDPPVELRVTDPQHGDSVVLEDPERGLRDAVERMTGIFGDGTSPYDLFAFGPHADLVGMPLLLAFAQAGEIPPPPVGGVKVRDVHPDSGEVPAFVNGLVDAAPPPDAYVGIAVNGTLGTVVPAMALPRQRTRFLGVVPDALFSDGDNDISAVWITGAGLNRRIQPIDHWGLLGDRLPPP